MAANRFLGHALNVAQVDTQTYGGTWEADDVVIYTINGKSVTVTAGSTVIATLMATVAAALNASTIPEFAEITWAVASGTTITGTADTAGRPFTLTVTTTEAGGGAADSQTLSNSTTTSNAGRNAADSATNWSTGAVPAGTNTLYLQNLTESLLYGLDQSGNGTMAGIEIPMNYTGLVGLPRYNSDAGTGANGYSEYRPDYWAIAATAVSIGFGEGSGSGRIKLNGGSVLSTVDVFSTGSPLEAGLGAFIWKGTNASNVMRVQSGSVSVAPFVDEAATILTLRNVDGSVDLGAGVTLTTVEQLGGGSITARSAMTTVNIKGGSVTVFGSGAVTTVSGTGPGVLNYNGTGTITTLNATGGFVLDATNNEAGFTITTLNINGAFTLIDPNRKVTITNWTKGSDVVGLSATVAA